MEESMIRTENLTKVYGTQKAVDDVSFEVKSGEILGFLGPNGAGKTTTMKMITCYMPPTSGNIYIDDYNVFDHSIEIRRKIGYLPENTPLYNDMGVLDYLGFIANVRGLKAQKQKDAIERVIHDCGLKGVIHKDIEELSKGYRQRVGLAQAIIHDPEILILDEPTSGLDPNQIIEIRGLIKKLGEQKTVIFSTHIMQEVSATSDRVLIINNGKIAAQGTPEELQANAKGQQLVHLEVKAASEKALTEQLLTIESANIEHVKKTNGTIELDVKFSATDDKREAIFDLAVANNWKILEMTPSRLSLEDVFRQLTN
jgi:ABC-2 type transport system ATP-binding protein